MTFKRLLTTAAAVSLMAGLTPLAALAQTPPTTGAAAPTAAPGGKLVASGDITATLRQSPDFTTFVKALDATNLAALLQQQPNLTVFAPTNAAFAALPPGRLDALMADKTALQKLLLHHIINAPVPSAKIKGARGPVPSGAGDPVILDGSGDVLKVDNANIVQADVVASNGTIHVVDAVLIAGSVPATAPEPAAEAAPEAAPPATPAAKPKASATKK